MLLHEVVYNENRIEFFIVSNRILTPFPVDRDRRRCLLLATYLCIKSNPRICHVTVTIISSIRSILQYSTVQYYVNILLVDCYFPFHFITIVGFSSFLGLVVPIESSCDFSLYSTDSTDDSTFTPC